MRQKLSRTEREKRLYVHPESDSYFYEKPGYVGDGLCHDVTGNREHERKARAYFRRAKQEGG